MKSLFYTLAIFAIATIPGNAQPDVRIETGTINCADYRILFPENYQNKLVMYAHGYAAPGSPAFLSGGQFERMAEPFLDRGFAVAASEYAYQGFALSQGVDDTDDLRQYFWDVYGVPDTTFMTGTSMGGGITLAMMENFSATYDGGLAMCPLSSRPYVQTRKEFEMRALFEVLFPGILTPLAEILELHSDYTPLGFSEMGPTMEAIQGTLAREERKAAEFARQFSLKVEDIAFTVFFGEAVLRDVVLKCGGNPYDNTNTVYTGFSNSWEINQTIARFEATANPDNIFEKYDRTGNLGKPVVLLHTIYDQLIPADPYGVSNFETMVHQQGKDHFLTVRLCNGQGHCAFTPEQIGQAFDALRTWVHTGTKAKAGILE